jgi:hemerythrin-like domain-containing protein
MTSAAPTSATADPVVNFTDCHAGILRKLDNLGTLPALLEPAVRARRIAQEALEFFGEIMHAHHGEEEDELFPAVKQGATPGAERDQVQALAQHLTEQHRELEALWKRIEPGLKRVAKGQDSDLAVADLERMVGQYTAHARFEETEYLPLAHAILSRQTSRLEALDLALHLRHAPQVVGYV